MRCEHLNFSTTVGIHRMSSVEGGPVTNFSADISIKCAECGIPFEFVGVAAGLSYMQPRVNLEATELRAPIKPQGSLPPPAYPGFNIRMDV